MARYYGNVVTPVETERRVMFRCLARLVATTIYTCASDHGLEMRRALHQIHDDIEDELMMMPDVAGFKVTD